MPVSLHNITQVNNTQPIKQSTKNTCEKQKSSTSTKTLVTVGAGLIALATVGIYIATKGKAVKATQDVVQNSQKTTNAIKEMTVDAFKQAGNKFNKGKAITNTGEAFTGNITHQTKDGKNIVREYENGVLKKLTKYDGENILSQKEYIYSKDGDLSVVQDGKLILKKITNTKDSIQRIDNLNGFIVKNTNTGKIETLQIKGQGRKHFYYDDNGTLKKVKHDYSSKDGVFMHDTIIYSPDGNKKMKIDGIGRTEFYDKNGVPIDEIHVDIYRGNSFLYYHNLQYNESRMLGKFERTYSYTTPQGIEGIIFRYNMYEKDKNKVRSILFLKTPDNNEYVVTRNGKDVLIKRNIGQETIVKGSDEYKNILAQSNDFIKQFFVKYKTALGLQCQVNESLRNFG